MCALLEMQLGRELCRPGAANRVQCALLPAKAEAYIDVRCGRARAHLAESRTYRAARAAPEAIRITLRSWTSKHRMVEYIEVFCAQIELDAFSEAKLAAQREIGLVERVWTTQPVSGEVPRLPNRW